MDIFNVSMVERIDKVRESRSLIGTRRIRKSVQANRMKRLALRGFDNKVEMLLRLILYVNKHTEKTVDI